MNVPFVDLRTQYHMIKDEMDQAVSKVLSTASFIGGTVVKTFEEDFARFCSARFCVGVGNGTDALYLALRCSGIGEGDEVIVPANTFVATSEAVTMTGAGVVFCDIDPRTYTIDVERIKGLLNHKTKAVIPVHIYGHPADMEPVLALARENGLVVIEDAAQAHGAEYMGKRAGTLGHLACFSFYPGKNLGAYGDGGAVVTDDPDLAEKIRMTANHGRSQKHAHVFEGINSRLDGIQAAVLSTKLGHLEEWTEQRRNNAGQYSELLAKSGVLPPLESPLVRAVYHLYVIRVPGGKRDALRDHLAENGISTGIHYPVSLPSLEAYAYLGHSDDDFPIATRFSKDILSLPMFPELTGEQIEHVVHTIRRFLG